MNKEQIQGGWDEFKGRVKMAYAELTDDDFLRADGSRDKLCGIIEKRFGDSKEKVLEKVDSIHLPPRKPS